VCVCDIVVVLVPVALVLQGSDWVLRGFKARDARSCDWRRCVE